MIHFYRSYQKEDKRKETKDNTFNEWRPIDTATVVVPLPILHVITVQMTQVIPISPDYSHQSEC